MEGIINTLLDQYGILGIILVLVAVLVYLIFGDRKNNWGGKIDLICDKVQDVNDKIEWVEDKLTEKINTIEEKVLNAQLELKSREQQEAREQTSCIVRNGHGGQLSKVLRSYCRKINCDHVFMGLFHNGITDLRGIHYCKFDIIIDEYENPLKLNNNDTDFQQLYKDENIVAYGNLPYQLARVESAVFDLENEDLLNLSNTLYRRCKGRNIKTIGFAGLKDKDGFIMGFIGCVSYTDKKMKESNIQLCAREIENIYINNEQL